MLTKGAIGNLINRYRAVLKKCHLINTFGSLAVASMLVMGGAGVAEASNPLYISNTISSGTNGDGSYVMDNTTESITVSLKYNGQEKTTTLNNTFKIVHVKDNTVDTTYNPDTLNPKNPSDIPNNSNYDIKVAPSGAMYNPGVNSKDHGHEKSVFLTSDSQRMQANKEAIVTQIYNHYGSDITSNVTAPSDADLKSFVVANSDTILDESEIISTKNTIIEDAAKGSKAYSDAWGVAYGRIVETNEYKTIYETTYNNLKTTGKTGEAFASAQNDVADSQNDLTTKTNALAQAKKNFTDADEKYEKAEQDYNTKATEYATAFAKDAAAKKAFEEAEKHLTDVTTNYDEEKIKNNINSLQKVLNGAQATLNAVKMGEALYDKIFGQGSYQKLVDDVTNAQAALVNAEQAYKDQKTAIETATKLKNDAETAKGDAATALTEATGAKNAAETAKGDAATALTEATKAKNAAEGEKITAENTLAEKKTALSNLDKNYQAQAKDAADQAVAFPYANTDSEVQKAFSEYVAVNQNNEDFLKKAVEDVADNFLTDATNKQQAENAYITAEVAKEVEKIYNASQATAKYTGDKRDNIGSDVSITATLTDPAGYTANSLHVSGKGEDLTGTLENMTSLGITTYVTVDKFGTVANTGKLTANGPITISGGEFYNGSATSLLANTTNNSYVRTEGDYTVIEGGAVTNYSDGTISAENVIVSGSGSSVTNSGLVEADTNIEVKENGSFTNSGEVEAGADVIVGTGSEFTNSGTVTAGQNVTVAGTFDNDGTVKAVAGNVSVEGSFSNGDTANKTASVIAGQKVTVANSGAFGNYGNVEAGTDVEVNGSFTNYAGTVTAKQNVTVAGSFTNHANASVEATAGNVSVSGTFGNYGNVKAGTDVEVNAGGIFTNSGSVTAGQNVTVANGGTFTNNANASVEATAGNVSVSGMFTNNGTVNAYAGNAADSGNVYVSGTFTNGGTVNADKNVELNGTKFSNTGTVTAGQNVVVKNGTFDNDKVVEATAGNVTVSGGTFDNDGTVKVANGIVVSGGMFNNAGAITKLDGTATDLALSGGEFTNSAAGLEFGKVSFADGKGIYSNTAGASTIGNLTGSGSEFKVSGGTVSVAQSGVQLGKVSVSGGKLDLDAGTLGATELTVSGGTFENDAIVNAGSFELSGDGIYDNNKTTSVTNTLTVSGGTFNNNASAGVTAGDLTVEGGKYNNSASTSVTGDLTVSGGTFNNNASVEAGNIEISGGEFNTVAGSTVAATNDIVIKGGKSDGAEHIVNEGTMTAGNKFDLAKGDFTNAGNLYVGNSVNVSSTLTNTGTLGGIPDDEGNVAKNPDVVVTGGIKGSIKGNTLLETSAGQVENSGTANIGKLDLQGFDITIAETVTLPMLGGEITIDATSSAGSYTNTAGVTNIAEFTTTGVDLSKLYDKLPNIPVGGKLNVEGGTVNIAKSDAILQGLTLGNGTLNIGDTVNKSNAEGGKLVALDSTVNGGTLNAHNAFVGLADVELKALFDKIKDDGFNISDLSGVLTGLTENGIALKDATISVSSSEGVLGSIGNALGDLIKNNFGSDTASVAATLSDPANTGSTGSTGSTTDPISGALAGMLKDFNVLDGLAIFGNANMDGTSITADNALAALIGGATLQNDSNLTVKNSAIGVAVGDITLNKGTSFDVQNGAIFGVTGNLEATGGSVTVTDADSALSTLVVGGTTDLKENSTLTVDSSLAILNGNVSVNNSTFKAVDNALVTARGDFTAADSTLDILNGGKLIVGEIEKVADAKDAGKDFTTTNTAITVDGDVDLSQDAGTIVEKIGGALGQLAGSNGELPDVGTIVNKAMGLAPVGILGVVGDATLTGGSLTATDGGIVAVKGDFTADVAANGASTLSNTADIAFSTSALIAGGNVTLDGRNASFDKSLLYSGNNTTLNNSTVGLDSSVAVLGGNALVGGITKVIENLPRLNDGKVDLSKVDEALVKKAMAALANDSIKTELDGSALALNKSLVAAVGQLDAKNGSSLGLKESAFFLGGNASLGNSALSLDKSAFAMGGGLTIGEGSAVTASNSGLVIGDQLNATNRDASFEKSLLYVGDATTLTNSDLTLNSSVAVLGGDVVADATAAAAFKVMNKMAQVDFANLTDPEYVKEALKIYGDLALDKLTDLKPEDVAAYLAAHKSDTTLTDSALTLNKADGAALGSTAVVFGDLTMKGNSSAALTGSSLLVLDDIHAGKSSLTAKDGSLVAMTGDLTAAAGNAITVTNKSGLVVGDNFTVTGRAGNKVENSALYVGDNTTLTNAPLTLSSSVAVLGGDMATDALAGLALDVIKNNDLTVEKLSNLTAQQAFSNIAEAFEGKLDNKTPEQIAKYINDNTRDTILSGSALTLNKAEGEALGSTVAAFGDLTATNSNIDVQGSNLLVLGDTTLDNASALSVTDKSVMAMGGSLTVGSAASTFAARTAPAPLTVADSVLAVGDILDVTGRAVNVSKSALYVGDQTNLTNAPLTMTDSVAVLGGDVLADPVLGSVWTSVQDADLSKVELSTDIVERGFKKILKDIDDKLDTVDGQNVIDYLAANMRDVTLNGSDVTATGSTIAAFGNLNTQGENALALDKSQLFLLGSANINEDSSLSAKGGSMVAVGNMLNASGNVTTEESVLFVGNGTNITDATLDADKTLAILGGGEAAEVFADTVYDALKDAVSKLNAGETLSADAIKAILVNNLPTKAELKALVTDGGKTMLKGASAQVDGSLVAVLGDLEAQKGTADSTIALGSSAMGVAGNATLTDTGATAANGSTLFVGKNTSLTDSSLSADASVAVLGGGNFVEHLADFATRSNGNISMDYDNLTASLRAEYGSLRNALASVLHDSANTTLSGSALSATNNSVVAVVGDLTAKDSSTVTATGSSLFVGGDTGLTGSTLTASGNAANMVAMAGSLKANDSEASVTGSSMFVGNNANLTSGSSLALNGSMTMIGGGEVLEEMAAGIYDDIRDAVSQLANGTQLSADAIKSIVVNNLPGAADLKQLVTEGGNATITDSTLSASNKSLVAVLGDLSAVDTAKDDAAEVALNASAMGVAGSATLTKADVTAEDSALFVGKNTTLVNSSLSADGSVALLGGGEAVEQMAAALIDRTADGNISVSFDNLAANLQQKYGSLKNALAGILANSANTTLIGSDLEAADGSVVAVMGDLAASSNSSVAANAASLFVGGDTSLNSSELTANGNAANMVAMAGSLKADASTVTTKGSTLFVGNDTELENASSLTTNRSVAVLGGGEVVERIAQKLYAAAKDAKNGIEEVINDPSKLSLDALVAFVKSNLPTVAEVKKDLTKGGDTTLSGGSTLNATNGSTVTVLGDLTVNTGNTINVTTGSALVGMAHTTVDGTLNVLDSNSSALLWNTVAGADALSGNGIINNAGTFTVADGYVDEFKGTFNQTAGTAYINKEYDNDTDSYFHKDASLNISGGTFVADADKVLNTGWGSLTVGATTYDKVLQYNVTSGNPVDVVANNLKADKDGTLHLDLEGGYYTRTHYTIAKSELAEQALTSGNGGAALVFINGTLITDPNERIMAGGLLSESSTHLTINSLDSTGSAMTVIAGRDISVQTAYDATDSNYRFDPQIGNMLYLVEKDDDHQTLHNLSNVTLSGTKFAANGLIVGDVDKLNIADGAVVTLGGTGDALIGSEATDGTISAITDVDIAVTSGSTLNIGAAGQQARAEGTVGQITADGTLTITNADLTLSEAAGLTSKGTTTVTDSTVNGDTTVSGGSFMADVAATTKSILNGLLTVLGGSATLDGTEVTGETTVSGGIFTAQNNAKLASLAVSGGTANVNDSSVNGNLDVTGGTATVNGSSVSGATSVAANGTLTADNASLQAVATAGTFTAQNGTTMTGLEVTGSTANVNGSSVNGNLDVTGGTANMNGSTVSGATTVAANGTLTADNSSLQAVSTAGTFTAQNGTTMTGLEVTDGTANVNGSSVNGNLDVTGGTANVNGSTVSGATSVAANGALTADNASLQAVATAGTFTAKNGTTMTDLTVSGGTANLTGETDSRYNVSLNDLTVSGGLLKITDSNVTVTTLNTNGGSIFVDPSYFEVATLTNSTLNSEFIIGDGSKVSIGGTVAGAPADSNLILGKSIKLGNSGSLLVDPAVKADSTYTAPGAGNAVFAANSMLAVNASTSDYAITGSGTLTVDADAKLYLNKVAANNTYLIANFDQGATVDGWQQDRTGGTDHTLSDGDNLIVNRTLDALTKVEDGKVTIVTSEAVDSEFMTEALPKNALHELAEEAADVYAKDAGKQFLSRAADSTYMPSEDDAISAINEVTRAALTAGVQNTALRVSDMAARTVVDHMSLSQHDGSKVIHADGVDFWAAPMYGNLFTSGMVTADSSVRGQFGGLVLGMDMESQQILGGKVRVGAALNGGGGQSTAKGNVTRVSNDYNFGGVNVYAGWNKGAFNVIGSIGYGFADHEVDMSLPGSMQMGSAKTDIDTTAVTAELRAEYQFKTSHVDVLPHAGIRYTSLQTDAHDLTVNGSVLNSVKSDTQNIVQFPIGVTFTKDFEANGWNVKPMADISVIPAAGEKDAHTKVNFSGMDAWDSVNTRIMDSTSWSGTVGVQAEKGNFSLGLNYGVQASSNETAQNIQLKLGWKF